MVQGPYKNLYIYICILENLENMVRLCKKCQEHVKNPKASTPGTWSWPIGPSKRIHIDYGPVRQLDGLMFLVVVVPRNIPSLKSNFYNWQLLDILQPMG